VITDDLITPRTGQHSAYATDNGHRGLAGPTDPGFEDNGRCVCR
jgi:hypothetical protein